MADFNEKIINWSAQEGGNEFVNINELLRYLGDHLYHDYEPALGPFPKYYSRLQSWVDNVSDETDQKNLLRIASLIFYVGREEFNSLYRTAYQTHIIRWIIEQENIKLNDPKAMEKIIEAIGSVWFCPVTDSLRINQFYHVNQIHNVVHKYRPDWKSLKRFGDKNLIKDYLKKEKVKYLVLLEDFVGSATQSWRALEFACEIQPEVKVLFVPLIICKLGLKNISDELKKQKNFTIQPVLLLPGEGFIAKDKEKDEITSAEIIRKTINKAIPFYKQKVNGTEIDKKFGFEDMGCLLVMHSNTPTNSLPVIYYNTNNWSALFSRQYREKSWTEK
jgi:hypothetical protein